MEKNLNCPFCDSQNVHPEKVFINRCGEITDISHNGTKMKTGPPEGRGATIEIVFWCEGFHKWIHRIQYHKGNTTIMDILILEGLSLHEHVNDLCLG